MNRSKNVRKAVYKVKDTMKERLPTTDILEDEITYCQKLVEVIEKEAYLCEYPKIKEPLNLLKETIADDIEQLRSMGDQNARVGHKSVDSSFFGYKTHLAMCEERIRKRSKAVNVLKKKQRNVTRLKQKTVN